METTSSSAGGAHVLTALEGRIFTSLGFQPQAEGGGQWHSSIATLAPAWG